MKDSFIIYTSFYEPIKSLSDKQLGRIFRALFDYRLENEVQVEDDIKMAFLFFKNQMDIDERKYNNKVETNKQNGSKGGAPKGNNNARKKTTENNRNNRTVKKTTETSLNDNDNDLKPPTPLKGEERDLNIPFENFWDLYDKKVGDKSKLQKKWEKLHDSERLAIMEYVPKYKKSQPDKKYRKNPETFLNNKSWNDEIINKNLEENEKRSTKQEQPQYYRKL